jgi:hypothetical protein
MFFLTIGWLTINRTFVAISKAFNAGWQELVC